MSRATVDLQSVRFFLGYGLIFFFQHVFTVVGVGVLVFVDLVEARADRARGLHRCWSRSPTATATSRTRCCATCSRRWPTSRRSPRRTSSASTSSRRSRRSRPSRTSSSARSEALFARACARTGSARSTCRCSSFLPLLGAGGGAARRRATWSRTARSRSATFVAFNLYLAMLIFPLRMLGMWIGEGQRATASGERIFQVIDEPEEIRDAPARGELPPGPGHVRFEDVTFGYDPARPVLDGDRPRARAGQDGRADRSHRLRQDDARLADPALLRRAGGPRDDRRRRRARRDARRRCAARSA